mmetsp:Transcript_38839/g.91397  ORF Transcript_38839/g.91397 Transcript_38839/m.91397 type:complete len:99 (-) Transcript_38839:197-493(-)
MPGEVCSGSSLQGTTHCEAHSLSRIGEAVAKAVAAEHSFEHLSCRRQAAAGTKVSSVRRKCRADPANARGASKEELVTAPRKGLPSRALRGSNQPRPR